FLQRQLRQLHILRGIKGLHPFGKDDVSGSIRPQAVDRLYEGSLAAAGLSLDEGPFARPEAHIADRQERLCAVSLMHERKVADRQAENRILLAIAKLATTGACVEIVGVLDVLDRVGEAG